MRRFYVASHPWPIILCIPSFRSFRCLTSRQDRLDARLETKDVAVINAHLPQRFGQAEEILGVAPRRPLGPDVGVGRVVFVSVPVSRGCVCVGGVRKQ